MQKEMNFPSTGWTSVNLLYLPDSLEITFPEGLTV